MAKRVENVAGDRERHGGGTEMAETSFRAKQTQFLPPGPILRNKANVRQEKLGKEDVREYIMSGNLL